MMNEKYKNTEEDWSRRSWSNSPKKTLKGVEPSCVPRGTSEETTRKFTCVRVATVAMCLTAALPVPTLTIAHRKSRKEIYEQTQSTTSLNLVSSSQKLGET